MKDTHFLYTFVVLGVVAISAVFVGYATDTLPTDTPRQVATTPSDNKLTGKTEKGCNCCGERLAKFREFMEARKRKKAAAQQRSDAQSTAQQ